MRLHVAGSDKLFVTLMLNGVVGADVSSSQCDELIDIPVSISASGPAPSAVVRPHRGNDV